ncbi:MAG: GNAT family N-acetyltransferase [Bacteroidales bacterium]|jgi:GNAT superfamily N-acetyltransferase|nr:GNAT family N-acetyltransferase [Bacteroidales bacterium]MDD3725091.1 GNAT family N-acetyltransferase [Bacteroidales bacterium]MDD4544920.1 GNAT family N-acetyltransferase [Bacteroidales bacterium]MDY0053514.1 GNAT family N-acetyltransferase [Bacteroidales bacterium]
MEGFEIREARAEDSGLILWFIKQLAIYEKLPHEVVADEATIYNSIFVEKRAKVVFAVLNGKEIGFALYFFNFSTFMGRPGLYLEDLFVLEEYRGKGFGKDLLKHLAKIAVKEKCTRFEWIVLDWNTPSIDFYKSLGAKPLEDWTVFRLQGEELERLAE